MTAPEPTAALIQFRKCVLLQMELEKAKYAMHELLHGASLNVVCLTRVNFLNAEIEMFADNGDTAAITQDHACWLFDHYPTE